MPVTRASVRSGYTIELFLKLPDPFVGAHGFMGIFSWVDRAGEAGKHNGYSALEPTCSMNVSGERFLQYVVYPEVQDASPFHLNPTSTSTPAARGRSVGDGRLVAPHLAVHPDRPGGVTAVALLLRAVSVREGG